MEFVTRRDWFECANQKRSSTLGSCIDPRSTFHKVVFIRISRFKTGTDWSNQNKDKNQNHVAQEACLEEVPINLFEFHFLCGHKLEMEKQIDEFLRHELIQGYGRRKVSTLVYLYQRKFGKQADLSQLEKAIDRKYFRKTSKRDGDVITQRADTRVC